MEKQIDTYMRIGIVHFMAFPELGGGGGPWVDTLRHIALDPYFTAVEITHIKDSTVRNQVRELIGLARLSVVFGAQPVILGQGLNINHLKEIERVRACREIMKLLDEAVYMGAENFVVLSGKEPGEEKREEALEALILSLKELCGYSEAKGGPRIVVEIFDADVDKCCLLGPAPLGKRVAQAVREDCSNFGLLVDLSHIPLLGESPEAALIPVKEYLTGVHIGNAVTDPTLPGYGDNHPVFGAPGSANDVTQVVQFLRTLLDIGFLNPESRPIVSFEIKPSRGQDPLVAIANARRVMKEAWRLA